MSQITTHILDVAAGHPAAGVDVRLEYADDGDWTSVASGQTDADGRVGDLGPERLPGGIYRLVFQTGEYHGADPFFPEVVVTFAISDSGEHYHVPLLLSRFGYSTYRGS